MRLKAMCAALILAASATAAAQTPNAAPNTGPSAQPNAPNVRAPGAPSAANPQTTQPPSLADILAQSPASDWRPLDPDNVLYMELPNGRVIIELSPDFSPQHVANVRAL